MTDETIDVPKALLARHLASYALEGPWQWSTSDEIRDKVDATDILKPSNCEHIDVREDHIEAGFATTSSESEKVARRTHHHPAEYKNHDVSVYALVVMDIPEDPYDFAETTVHVEQEGGKPMPPGYHG